MRVIDLNADLGEGVGDDEALLRIVTTANIATGAHAGGGSVLARAVAMAVARGVSVGAHPSYRDRPGFGRASHLHALRADLGGRAEFTRDLVEQCLDVARAVERSGAVLTHVKAHGSLYNEAVYDALAAEVVLDAVHRVGELLGYPVAVMTQPHGRLAERARAAGVRIICEGFVDRGYAASGHLVARGQPGDLHDSLEGMVGQALDLASGSVRSVEGERLEVAVDTLCVHGDTPDALGAAGAVHGALVAAGWQVRADRAPRTQVPHLARLQLRAVPFGDRAVLLEPLGPSRPRTAWVLRVAGAARARWPGAQVVAGVASVLMVFDRPADRPDPAQVGDELASSAALGSVARHGALGTRSHTLDVRYDGADLADLARAVGVSAQEVVRRHSATTWTVAAVGFSPGFGYLTCADPLFDAIGRRDDPRPRVSAGSVALAAGMCAVYPSASPGGWHLLGSTDADLFDARAEPPALLALGDLVRFREVGP